MTISFKRRIAVATLTTTLALSTIQTADAQGHRWRGGRGAEPTPTTSVPAPVEGDFEVNAELLYLIEEEKLAYDVYRTMYQKYGTRIFNNISASEQTHQNAVLSLLRSRGLADPRLGFGQFRNPELQQLYNDLTARGNVSYRAALEVGRDIELMDIADINTTLPRLSPADADVSNVLQNLLRASHNHLRAFERQLGR